MSLVFLKSADDKQDGRYNPNKPYRFSNYLTNPIRIPKNAQVAYVSSQFLVDGNGIVPDEASYISTGEDKLDMFEMPVMFRWQSNETRTSDGWKAILNSWALSSNEFGMDGDFTPAKFALFAGDSSVPQAESGFRTNYITGDNKVNISSNIRFPADVYNLYFNAYRANPPYNGGNWVIGGAGLTGATIGPGLNFSTGAIDPRYETDCRIRSRGSPSGSISFIGGNNYGFRVGLETNIGNARNKVYEGGANWYNTGFSSTGLDGNAGLYQFGGPQGASAKIMPFNAGRYGVTMGTTGLKKCVGDFTPNNTQQNNRGGHQAIGHLGSGGYCIWTNCNLDQALADAHYTVPNCTRLGFCGFAPQFVGLHSIPYVRQRGYDLAVDDGVLPNDARNVDTQIDYFMKKCDLNNSSSSDIAEHGDARFLIGLDILNEGTAPNIDCVVRAKILDCLAGKIQDSQYKEIGAYDGEVIGGFTGLSLKSLSRGINTACSPAFTFDATADYSINTFNTTPGRTSAGLFFRFRWENKFQIAIEFTLSVDGFAGTYNNATDEPYAPAPVYADPPDSATADPRDKWCLLARMDVTEAFVEKSYYIPSLMGDLGLVQYPIASTSNTNAFRQQIKGWFDPRETNRFFQDNNNGGGKQYAPYSVENPFWGGYDSLGVWTWNSFNPLDPDKTSLPLINSGYDGTEPTEFTPTGILETGTKKWLGVKLNYPLTVKAFYKTNGRPAYNTPKSEIAYIFGFLTTNDPQAPIDLDVNPILAPSGSYNVVTSANEIDATNEAFSNHVQITNLPIVSSNGVVSSICKTIYVVDSLCIHDTHDDAQYRYYCHQAPYPLWIDLNNLEEIQLNKLDILIAQDNNTEQLNLTGETQIVIMFRSKEEGVLPNTISVQNISTTRTY